MAATAPMYWFTASRPLSDMPGLAAALAVQALILTAITPARLATASFLAAFATGLRSQVAWLTVPLLALEVARRPRAERPRAAAVSIAAFVLGGLMWGIPLVVLTGGPRAYWHAVFDQGAEDLTGIQMLWTTPTVRQLVLALQNTFVAPWASAPLGIVVVLLAVIGAIRLLRDARPVLATLAAAFVPYLVFDLLFQSGDHAHAPPCRDRIPGCARGPVCPRVDGGAPRSSRSSASTARGPPCSGSAGRAWIPSARRHVRRRLFPASLR
jgi:hypothetical protein